MTDDFLADDVILTRDEALSVCSRMVRHLRSYITDAAVLSAGADLIAAVTPLSDRLPVSRDVEQQPAEQPQPVDPWVPVKTKYGVARWKRDSSGRLLYVDGYGGSNFIAVVNDSGGWSAYAGRAGNGGKDGQGTWTGDPASCLSDIYAVLRECGTLAYTQS